MLGLAADLGDEHQADRLPVAVRDATAELERRLAVGAVIDDDDDLMERALVRVDHHRGVAQREEARGGHREHHAIAEEHADARRHFPTLAFVAPIV